MKQKTFFKYLIAVALFVFVVSGGFLLYKYFTLKNPVEEMSKARKILAQTEKQLEGEFVNQEFVKAQNLYKRAMEVWQLQNDKFFAFRNYTQTKDLASRAVYAAINASNEAQNVKKNLIRNIEKDFAKASAEISLYEKKYKNLPLSLSIHQNYSVGKLKFFEAQKYYEKGEENLAVLSLTKSMEHLTRAKKDASLKLQQFFSAYDDWQNNYNRAFSLSKNGHIVILVDKMEASLNIIKSGKVIHSFPAEFGTNWMGDKMKAGDSATPEGVYKIVEKKQGVKTKYYKALLLNYPNNDDKARFDKLQKAGVISKKETVGGLIEIHGDGEKGINWTQGCIALSNNNMDAVYKNCAVNTPVIIIGSVKTLEEYLNSK